MNTNRQEHVSSEETIVRLLNREWIVNGTLVQTAFQLRNVHAKSHAGIFTRIKGNNVKGGQTADVVTNSNGVFSATMILQKMRWKLLSMAKVETCGLAFDK